MIFKGPNTSRMAYRPGERPISHSAARSAPRANTMRSAGAMGQFQPFALRGKSHRMLADDVARPAALKIRCFRERVRPGMLVPGVHREVGKTPPARAGDGDFTQRKRRTGGRISFHPVVRLVDLHVVCIAQRRRRKLDQPRIAPPPPRWCSPQSAPGCAPPPSRARLSRRVIVAGCADQQGHSQAETSLAHVTAVYSGRLKSIATAAPVEAPAAGSAVTVTPVGAPPIGGIPSQAGRSRRKRRRRSQRNCEVPGSASARTTDWPMRPEIPNSARPGN